MLKHLIRVLCFAQRDHQENIWFNMQASLNTEDAIIFNSVETAEYSYAKE